MLGNYTSPPATDPQQQEQFPQSRQPPSSKTHPFVMTPQASGKWLFKPPDHVMPQSSLDKLFDNNKKSEIILMCAFRMDCALKK